YASRVDTIVGLVNVLDVLCAERKAATIAPFVRKDIRYEPESRRVYSLLRELRISRSPMVFVVDEYGGVVGLVTLEDLIEEILGDIRDEKDREDRKAIHPISDRVIECDGKTEIVLINNRFGMSIPPGDYNTVGGYVFSLLERIPEEGEIIETEAFKITVLDADDRRVRRVRIQKNI
ncbi:MAG: transporter associated domain-containing protein, partial [Candidatus Aminicenantales bacterium]